MKMKKIILIIGFLLITSGCYSQALVRNVFEGTGTTDTTTVALVDTLSRAYTDSSNSLQSEMYGLFERWYRLTIAANDTLLVSTNITFPSNQTFRLDPDESRTYDRWNVYAFPNVYVKSAYIMPVRYRFSFEGD